jgi:hypothetical protein
MENKIKHIIFNLLLGIVFSSCLKNTDFSGFVVSSENADERFAQSEAWNKIHLRKKYTTDSSSYTFYVAADLHIGGLINFKKFLNTISNNTNCFYCLAGDITTGRKEDYDRLDTFLIFNDTTRHFFTNGNHELYFEGWKYYFPLFGSTTYTVIVNTKNASDLLIFLDSGNGTLGKKQMSWLENVLDTSRQKYRNCFVFTHTNFFMEHNTTSTNLLPEEVSHLIDLFANNNVNMVFMGHDHRRSVEHFGKTTYITLDALKDGLSNVSYLKCNVNGSTISYQFVPVE